MLLDFPDTIFGNCAPHKLPFSQIIEEIYFYYIIKICKYIYLNYIVI